MMKWLSSKMYVIRNKDVHPGILKMRAVGFGVRPWTGSACYLPSTLVKAFIWMPIIGGDMADYRLAKYNAQHSAPL